jgi:hypothetical protein
MTNTDFFQGIRLITNRFTARPGPAAGPRPFIPPERRFVTGQTSFRASGARIALSRGQRGGT